MGLGLGPWEIVLILVVLLLVFGARRLPELGSSLGKGIREFKGSLRSIESDLDATDSPPQTRQQVHAPPPQSQAPPERPVHEQTPREQAPAPDAAREQPSTPATDRPAETRRPQS